MTTAYGGDLPHDERFCMGKEDVKGESLNGEEGLIILYYNSITRL